MSTLELECPGCDQLLELDAGFAGGVCRCSNCGTLMTVPVDDGEAAEALQEQRRSARPERPDRPARPDQPGQPQPERPARPEAPAETTARADEHVYTTASGREVHVNDGASIPTAQRKRRLVIRTVTALIFASVLLVVLGLTAVGVWMLGSAQQEAAVRPVHETFEYDYRINPYEHPLANALGLPLAERAAVVVDASEPSRPWLAAMNHTLREGLLGTNSASIVGLVYANEQGLHVHPRRPTQLVHWRERDLVAFHAGIASTGEGGLGEAVARAVQWEPAQVILITGRAPREAELARLREALDAGDEVTLDVVTIDHDDAALDDLTYDYDGRYAPLTLDRLEQWRAVGDAATGAANAAAAN